MNRAWLDEPERRRLRPQHRLRRDTAQRPRYLLRRLQPLLRRRAGEPLSWQVGVYVESPPETRDEVLEILNEIRSQTP